MPQVWLTFEEIQDFFSCDAADARRRVIANEWERRRGHDGLTRALLPPEVQRNGVTTKKASTSLLQVVAIYSPKGSRDALFLSNYAKINIVDALKRVPGVGDAGQWGDLEYSMRIWLNLDRMASLDVTPDEVIKAINSQNTQAAAGRGSCLPHCAG